MTRVSQKNLPESSGSTRDKVFAYAQKEAWEDQWNIWQAQLDHFSIPLLNTAGLVERAGRSFPTEILSIQSTTHRIVWQEVFKIFAIFFILKHKHTQRACL